jgi:hypothetical protein
MRLSLSHEYSGHKFDKLTEIDPGRSNMLESQYFLKILSLFLFELNYVFTSYLDYL